MIRQKFIIKEIAKDFGDAPFGSNLKSKDYTDSGIPVIQGGNIVEQKFEWNNKLYVSEEKFNSLKRSHCRAGDLVFPKIGNRTVGSAAIAPTVEGHKVFLLSTNMMKVSFKPDLANINYVYYYFCQKSIREYIISIAGGGAQPIFNLTTLKNFEIELPPLPIQKKIAAILSAYDDLIENNTRRIKILEEMAQTLYHEWFVKFRFPGYEHTKMVDSELGLIPEGWEVRQLSEVCQRITDGSHWSPKSVDQGYPMASVKDMSTWGLNVESCRKISQHDYEKLVRNDCKPLKNDILIAKDGNTYLKHMFVVEKEIDLVILSSIAIVRPNLDNILPYILVFHLLDPPVKSRLKNYVSGAAIPRIILKDFAKFPIAVPSIDIQHKFFNIAEAMIKDCHCLIAKNHNLRQTRDLLLPKLISGEIDVEHLEITAEDIAA